MQPTLPDTIEVYYESISAATIAVKNGDLKVLDKCLEILASMNHPVVGGQSFAAISKGMMAEALSVYRKDPQHDPILADQLSRKYDVPDPENAA